MADSTGCRTFRSMYIVHVAMLVFFFSVWRCAELGISQDEIPSAMSFPILVAESVHRAGTLLVSPANMAQCKQISNEIKKKRKKTDQVLHNSTAVPSHVLYLVPVVDMRHL